MSHICEPVVLVASAEFTLKSSPVRRTLEQRVIDDLRFTLARDGFAGFRVGKDAARLVVHGIQETKAAAESCSRVFGVAYAAPAILLPTSMETVTQSIVNLAMEELQTGQTFAVRAHRSSLSPLSRRDIELKGGSEVLYALKDKNVSVDLGHPDVTFHVDLASDGAYLYLRKLQGPGGLPLSSQWKMLAVLDSGPLTILAACAMMRRGCLVELFIPISNTNPFFAKESQLNLAQQLRRIVTRAAYRAFILDLDRVVESRVGGEKIRFLSPRNVIRSVAVEFAKQKRFKGLIFADVAGEIGMDNLLVGTGQDLPIFTPLIGFDKVDLADLARLVGIREVALVPRPEDQSGSKPLTVDLSKNLGDVQVDQLAL